MSERYFADVQVNLRVYFDDNGTDRLMDQAVEALELKMSIPDEAGEIEDNGLVVLREPERVSSDV